MRALRAQRAAMPPSLAAIIARDVARALHHAHTRVSPTASRCDIVHRDVTPSNIMLLWTGGVKILDFGIAKAAALAAARGGRPPKPASCRGCRGSSPICRPSRCAAPSVDRRSDLFSLGVVLWEMVAGQRLFAGAERVRDDAQRADAADRAAVAAPRRHPGGAGRDRGARAGARARSAATRPPTQMADDLDGCCARCRRARPGDPAALAAAVRARSDAGEDATDATRPVRTPSSRPARPAADRRRRVADAARRAGRDAPIAPSRRCRRRGVAADADRELLAVVAAAS